jgi:hypothetical protein
MRLITILVVALLVGWGGYYAFKHSEPIRQFAHNALPSGEFRTLEIRYSAEEIMQSHKNELLKNSSYSFLEPKLLFYPYLMMDVKYAKGRGATGEGILLWGLNDGEMVIHTGTWEKTHGFEDCLAAKADKNDFKIIQTLVENGGIIDREKLYGFFNVDQEVIDRWTESCRIKKIIATGGNQLRLHLQNPLLKTEPATILDQPLVTQPAKHFHKVKGEYSTNQIKHFAQIAFGYDFAIRRTQEVYLPIYALAVQNPDGSVFTTYWNALNGKKMDTGFCR